MPSMDFSVEPKVLEYFKMRAVKCKPEAPWLNRVNGTIQFTEELHEAGSETVSVTENSDHEEKPEPMESSQDLISTAPRRQYKSCVDFSKKFDTSEDEEHLDENTAEIFASVMKRKEEQYSEEEEALVFTPDHIVKRIDKICSPDNKFNKYPSYD